MDAKKTYEFTIKFGAETETCDAEGKITATTDKLPSLEELEKIIPQFTGKIRQKPPAYSAIKINGKRAYDLARKGIEFEIKEREVTIWGLEICQSPVTSRQEELKEATLRATCSKGTYIRSLARDIAQALGSLGHVTYLRRTEYGGFDLNNAVTIGDITKNKEEQNQGLQTSFESIISQIQPIDVVLDDIPVLHLDGDLCKRLRDGQSVNHNQAGSFRVYCNGKLHSIAKCDGEKLKTITVFN